jgi:hypothetical protein
MIKTKDETHRKIKKALGLGDSYHLGKPYQEYLRENQIYDKVLAGDLTPPEVANKLLLYAREQIGKALGHEVREPDWEMLVINRLVNDVLTEDTQPLKRSRSVQQAADWVRELEKRYDPRLVPRNDFQPPSNLAEKQMLNLGRNSANYDALVEQCATWASIDPEVQEFRARVFPDGLLPSYQAGWWVQHQAEREGTPEVKLHFEIIVPPTPVRKLRNIQGRTFIDPPLPNTEWDLLYPDWEFLYLKYKSAGGEPLQIRINSKGILGQLRELSLKLSGHYRWDESDATHFVLTDESPPIHAIKAIVEEYTINDMPFNALSRINFTIDPALSPDRVAKEYSHCRNVLLGGGRERDLSEKRIQLALFAANRPESESWAERKAAWDQEHEQEHPEWSYEGKLVTNFARDCNHAQKRLFGTDYLLRKSYPQRKKKPTQRDKG